MLPSIFTSGLLKLGFWCAALVIGILSLMPVDFLPPQAFDVWDKAQHAGAFAVLALLGLAAYPLRPWQVGLGLLAYGAAIELTQSATGWRFGDWLDLLADLIGILAGYLAMFASRRVRAAPRRQ